MPSAVHRTDANLQEPFDPAINTADGLRIEVEMFKSLMNLAYQH